MSLPPLTSRIAPPVLAGWAFLVGPSLSADEIDFNRDIRPILSDHCFKCHGPDAENQKSELRLDTEGGTRADLGGYFAVVPGDLEKSELHHRVWSDDDDEIMPPPEAKLALSQSQKRLLDQWIREGATYANHWAFEAIEKPALPELTPDLRSWTENGIDHFVAARLKTEGLSPSSSASRETWIRRVSLDLTGLPPTPSEVDAFIADTSPGAWETVVDRLLASPQYGEHMALPWLDAARYADTGGYQGDRHKTQWPWRDWVIDAYNRNLPFDQFTIEQLAGDLLPKATAEQRLATAFNRNHRINDEGGIIPEEFLVEYVADRVETTSTVWLGLTVGCARCHDHKYDPISQRDFYSLFAFFHNIPEKGKDGDPAPQPNMPVYTGGTPEAHEELKRRAAELSAELDGYAEKHLDSLTRWSDHLGDQTRQHSDYVALPRPAIHLPLDKLERDRFQNLGTSRKPALVRGTAKRVLGDKKAQHHLGANLLQGGYLNLGAALGETTPTQPMTWSAWVNPTREVAGAEGPMFSSMTSGKSARGYQISLIEAKDRTFHLGFRLHSDRDRGESIEVISVPTIPLNRFSQVAVSWNGSLKAAGVTLFIDGEAVPSEIRADRFGEPLPLPKDLLIGAETPSSSDRGIRDELLANTILDEIHLYQSALEASQVRALFRLPPSSILSTRDKLSPVEQTFLSEAYFRDHDPNYQTLQKEAATAVARLKGFESKQITTVSIMEEMPEPRDTFLLNRGVYDQPDTSEKLSPSVPEAVLPIPDHLPRNRLGLAQWLLLPEHPLTARVAVNRYWQQLFGAGLVRTPEDFGSQGMPPSHPALLDWLATEFRENGWDVKALLKLMVLSATYRQESKVTAELWEQDPENRLLARGPRFRLSGQTLRDQALAVSGRLDLTIGGPPVMPYQPDGLWEEVSAKGVKYVVGDGPDLYRRSLYTFWRRTVPPPSMMNFDSTSREICSVNLSRTNTPLQAMNLLNDPQFVEAARLVAERMIRKGGESPTDRIAWGHKLILAREPDDRVLQILTSGYADHLARYEADPSAAVALAEIGKSEPNGEFSPAELAALTAIASVIMNLDETVTKE